VTWPQGCKDANDVLRQHGADVLKGCIDHAEPFPILGAFTARDLSEKILHLY
jgi:twinkle protein